MSNSAVRSNGSMKIQPSGKDRRTHRRHDMETQGIPIDRWDGGRRQGTSFGRIVDISAGGVRIRTNETNVKPDHQIRVRMELPAYAGISPFIAPEGESLSPRNEWVGWMTINRVIPVDGKQVDVAGRLV